MGLFASIARAFGAKPSSAPSTLTVSKVDDLPLWRQFSRIGGAVTPEQLSGYLRQADNGRMAYLVGMAYESRAKDGHLHGVLQARELALQCLEWEWVYPDQDADSTRGLRQRRFLEEQTRDNDEFAKLIAEVSGDFYTGYSVTETVLRKDGGKLVLDYCKPVDARRVGFRLADGKICFRDDPNTDQEIDFDDYASGKFVITQRRTFGDIQAREGLMRVLLWSALFRNWAMSDWLKLAEIAWKPYRVGTYDKSAYATKEDQADLYTILENLSSSGASLIPSTVKLDVLWPQGGTANGTSNHQSLFSAVGREMSKAVLGQDATTEQSSSSGQAQAKVLERGANQIFDADARAAGSAITKMFARPLIRMNFGDGSPCPSLRFKIQRPMDITKVSSAIATLSNAGLRIPARWARQQIGAPTPADDEECVAKPMAETPMSPDADMEDAADEKDDAEA